MANLGASKFVIAEELGHQDTQQVNIYTEFTDEIFEILDDALSPVFIPLAQAFSGTLIDSEINAIRENDPRSRIGGTDGNPVGNANGVIHCYTCCKFQPWVNAPHKAMLQQVNSELDRRLSMGASEFTLQGYNRSIDAIKVVITMCESRKSELTKGNTINV